jgi:hypothetical protein
MAKSKIYPGYTNVYIRENDTSIILKRRGYDGVLRFIKNMNFESKEECDLKWENDCGA